MKMLLIFLLLVLLLLLLMMLLRDVEKINYHIFQYFILFLSFSVLRKKKTIFTFQYTAIIDGNFFYTNFSFLIYRAFFILFSG